MPYTPEQQRIIATAKARASYTPEQQKIIAAASARAAPAVNLNRDATEEEKDALIRGGKLKPRSFTKDVMAFTGGIGQGVGNIALTGERLLGGGLSAFGVKAGDAMVADANKGISRLESEMAPYKAYAPNVVATGNVIPSLFAGGVAGRALGAGAKMLGAGSKVAPLVAALKSGGFETGIIPKGAALIGKGAPSLGARAADLALRVGGGAATGAIGSAAVNPDETGAGAAFGAALSPVLGAGGYLAKAMYKSFTTPAGQKAAEIMRKTLGGDYDRALDALKNAPANLTARQALHDAGIDADAFMALGENIETGIGSPQFRPIRELQEQSRRDILAKAAGGQTATKARMGSQAAKESLTAQTTPIREGALARANVGGNEIPPLQQTSQAAKAKAKALAEQVRRYGPYAERTANDAQILASNPTMTIEELNKARGVAGLAENATSRAAKGSLSYGEEARTAEQKISELNSFGIRPLDIGKITSKIGSMANAPGTRADDVQRKTLTSLAGRLKDLAERNNGVIDARDLYQVRKSFINDTISKLLEKTEPSQKSARAAELLSKIKPMIDEAIEDAGGSGWKEYLQTFSSGAEEIDRQKLSALAQRLYKESPEQYAKLIRGEMPEKVEEVFGPGRFDIQDVLAANKGSSRMPALEGVAGEVERDLRIKELSSSGQQLAGQLALGGKFNAGNLLRAAGRIANPKTAYAADLVKLLINERVAPAIQKALIEGLQSGKSAAELLAKIPKEKQASVSQALANASKKRMGLAAGLSAMTERKTQ